MGESFLGNQTQALEDAFFAKQNAQLLQKLQQEGAVQARRAALSGASGITDETVLEQLIALDIHSETMAAMALVPLVAVAWADKNLDERERQAILSGAQDAGLDAEHTGYQLLETWLADEPGPELLSAWKAYIRALTPTLSSDATQALKRELLGRARAVAEAAGGFLGLGAVSRAEQAVLTELEQTFG